MLSINLSELIWAVINFLLLLFLLNRFLFKPMLSFMDRRQEKIDAGLAEERQAEQTVQENQTRLAGLKAECQEETRRIIAQADAAQEAELAQAITKAKKDAAEAHKATVEALAARRDAEAEKLAAAEPELAELLVRRLLGDEP